MLSDEFGRLTRLKRGYNGPPVLFIPVPRQSDRTTQKHANKIFQQKGKKPTHKVLKSKKDARSALLTYCDDTSLHAFKYFAQEDCHKMGRTFWSVALAVVYVLVTYLIWGQVLDFINSPVLISFQPEPTLISTIPFPAVTLCPDMQIRRAKFNLTAATRPGAELTEDELAYLYVSSIVCDMVFHGHQGLPWSWFYPATFRNFSFDHISYSRCRDFVLGLQCALKEVNDPCFYFQPTYSEQGGCFSYNLLPTKQLYKPAGWYNFYDDSSVRYDSIWSPDNGYEVLSKKQIRPTKDGNPPWAVSDSAVVTGYDFFLQAPLHLFEELCIGARGFHGFIHNPAEIPNSRHTYFYLSPNHHLDIKVEPQVQTVSPNLLRWAPESRMCYLQNERPLAFFKFYTQKNCEMECASNFSLQRCGCVSFNYPRASDTRICAPRAWACLSKFSEETDYYGASCNCLPACSEIEYGAQFTSVEKDWTERNYIPKNKSHETVHMSIRIHYRTKFVQAIKRSSPKTFIDLVADVGGLISLFTGFSILSLVEIFYHLFMKKRLEPESNLNDSTAEGINVETSINY
ncbi:Amiloride-sensitive sodium channel [Nesidiocoris tenuis]|uniref:Amiloride-sensitive sodium channel n=1 Tax=Nesidiocoris tenuis TaxID=355587 RepID=A0ABN7B864_9HEMI|nr:Amiloride-sensitive sodium channel [Nesidiocoris tenuis]